MSPVERHATELQRRHIATASDKRLPERPSKTAEATTPEPAQPNLHGVAETETAAVSSAELDRYRDAWRHTLEAVKDTLADLEAAVSRSPVEPGAAISGLVERLVAVATAAAEAAGRQVRTESEAEVARARVVLGQVRSQLQRERENLKSANQALEAERGARARAEAALEEAQGTRQQLVSTYESQLRALEDELEANRAELTRAQQQVETERAERTKLINAIKLAVDAGAAAEAPASSDRPSSDKHRSDKHHSDKHGERPSSDKASGERLSSEKPSSEKLASESKSGSNGVESRTAKNGTAAAALGPDEPETQQDGELVTYFRVLLGNAEAMYKADMAARRSSIEVVDRLTASLREARDLFAQRVGAVDPTQTALFEHLLAEVLNTSEETSFSRHLGIAAYESLSTPK